MEDYRRLINTLDKKLSLYEKFGTPKELAEKLGVDLSDSESRYSLKKVTAKDLLEADDE